jgi:hypothetical protein
VFRKTILGFVLLSGCNAVGLGPNPTTDGGTVDVPDSGTVVDPNGLPPVVESSKSRLQFRGGPLYAAMLSNGLGIAPPDLCKELGLYDCVKDVHRIALLDVEPYRTGIIEPLENTVVSTPIAVERVALSACTQWAKKAPATDHRGIAGSLYRGLLQRDPLQTEIDHLETLYAQMAEANAPSLDETWAAMSCFAVATTEEALFY